MEPTDVRVAEFFSLVDNHWDVFVETRALWSDVTDPLGAEPLHP